jgi:hypothetical protein
LTDFLSPSPKPNIYFLIFPGHSKQLMPLQITTKLSKKNFLQTVKEKGLNIVNISCKVKNLWKSHHLNLTDFFSPSPKPNILGLGDRETKYFHVFKGPASNFCRFNNLHLSLVKTNFLLKKSVTEK